MREHTRKLRHRTHPAFQSDSSSSESESDGSSDSDELLGSLPGAPCFDRLMGLVRHLMMTLTMTQIHSWLCVRARARVHTRVRARGPRRQARILRWRLALLNCCCGAVGGMLSAILVDACAECGQTLV